MLDSDGVSLRQRRLHTDPYDTTARHDKTKRFVEYRASASRFCESIVFLFIVFVVVLMAYELIGSRFSRELFEIEPDTEGYAYNGWVHISQYAYKDEMRWLCTMRRLRRTPSSSATPSEPTHGTR